MLFIAVAVAIAVADLAPLESLLSVLLELKQTIGPLEPRSIEKTRAKRDLFI